MGLREESLGRESIGQIGGEVVNEANAGCENSPCVANGENKPY